MPFLVDGNVSFVKSEYLIVKGIVKFNISIEIKTLI